MGKDLRVGHKIVIETDLGHDPDDFFAICYLVAAGVDIRAITLVPGSSYQVRLARMLTKELKLDIPIGASKFDPKKFLSLSQGFASDPNTSEDGADGGIHLDLLKKYGTNKFTSADMSGYEIVRDEVKYGNCDLFVIGPATSIGKAFNDYPDLKANKLLMQGGFLAYDQNPTTITQLDKFKETNYQPSFNFNGDRRAIKTILGANIEKRYFVGKHICHSIEYTPGIHRCLHVGSRPAELFREFGDLYFSKHQSKKFHDPTAAVCYLHPEITSCVRGSPIKIASGWGTSLDQAGDYIVANVDQVKLWEHITNFN